VKSPAFYESLPKTVAKRSRVSELDISSCCLIELAKDLGISKIYTVDEELAKKVKEVEIENPIPRNVVKKYCQCI